MEDNLLDDYDLFTNTPDNFLASREKRLLNYIIDSAVYVSYIIILMIIDWNLIEGTRLEKDYSVFAGFNLFLFPFFYKCISEAFFSKTIGKMFTKTHVINLKGQKVTLVEAFLRTLIRYTVLDVLSIFLNKDNLTWHDQFTGTRVVTDDYLASEFV